MIQNPSIWDYAGIKLTHKALPDIVHAVFIVSFIELRHTLLFVLRFREVAHVMILPDIVKAVQLVRADCRSNVTTAGFGWELRRPVGVFHSFYVLLRYANKAVCIATVHLAKGHLCVAAKVKKSQGADFHPPTFHNFVPSLFHLWRWWTLERALIP